ncbi:hypothetical protein [Paenibacillus hamazuiensis]|uniref:hypothetical protein n=1 Tax=Paenibacillus hamazuiensis TaxID=2936508 RepID=UPI00200C1AF1|nr:hypothetical protein [Paenibacillus hamazuiensis]
MSILNILSGAGGRQQAEYHAAGDGDGNHFHPKAHAPRIGFDSHSLPAASFSYYKKNFHRSHSAMSDRVIAVVFLVIKNFISYADNF